MDDNVFAAGEDDDGGGGTREATTAPFEFTDRGLNDVMGLLNRAWELTLANLGTIGLAILVLFGMSIVGQVINFALAMATELADGVEVKLAGQLLQQGVSVAFAIVQLYFQLGLMKIVINADRGHESTIDMLWSQGTAFLQAFVVTLVLGFVYVMSFVMVAAIIGGLAYGAFTAMGESGLLVGGLLAMVVFVPFLVGIVILGLGLSMMFYGLVDERAAWFDCLGFSWRLTMGWKGFLFIQGLVYALLMLVLACVTFCMALPVAQGVLLVAQAVTYNALITHADANDRVV